MSTVQHIFKAAGAPSTAPTESGHHYVDTASGIIYISKGSSSPADWVKIPTSKSDVGLGNVDNTSDVNKPVSSAQTTALAAKISRVIVSTSSNTTAASAAATDYFYFVSGTTTLTLPTAIGNTSKYFVKRVGAGVVTVSTTLSQTIDGSLMAPINVSNVSLEIVSDGSNWNII